MAPKEELGLPCFLGHRRKWGFQEATTFFFFFSCFKGKEPLPLYFFWTFAHLLSGGVSILSGPWLGAQNEGAQANHFVSWRSQAHLLSAKPKFIHSLHRHLLRACWSPGPVHQRTCTHKCVHMYVHAHTATPAPRGSHRLQPLILTSWFEPGSLIRKGEPSGS